MSVWRRFRDRGSSMIRVPETSAPKANRTNEPSNRKIHMPRDSYSSMGDGGQRPIPISEPDAQTRHSTSYADVEEDFSMHGVQAKEPERQTTARRGARRARSAMKAEAEQEEKPRSRAAAPRGGARRGTQARRAPERGQTARRTVAPETKAGRQKKSRRGFAAMSPEQQREIARKGGLTVSRNRRHMADIGRIGGEHSHGGRRARR